MKKIAALLLVTVFLLGLGFAVAETALVTQPYLADGPGIPPPLPPGHWPPFESDSVGPVSIAS